MEVVPDDEQSTGSPSYEEPPEVPPTPPTPQTPLVHVPRSPPPHIPSKLATAHPTRGSPAIASFTRGAALGCGVQPRSNFLPEGVNPHGPSPEFMAFMESLSGPDEQDWTSAPLMNLTLPDELTTAPHMHLPALPLSLSRPQLMRPVPIGARNMLHRSQPEPTISATPWMKMPSVFNEPGLPTHGGFSVNGSGSSSRVGMPDQVMRARASHQDAAERGGSARFGAHNYGPKQVPPHGNKIW